jgi:hypothetical protein
MSGAQRETNGTRPSSTRDASTPVPAGAARPGATPFVVVGSADAGVCVDGVCALPPTVEPSRD